MAGELRAAVIGVGYLGRFHAQKYQALPDCTLVGVVDANPETAARVSEELGVPAFATTADVLPLVDAVSVAVSTRSHYEVAKECLLAGKHLLVEKPLASTVTEAEELVTLAGEARVLMQVGYLERFNPAFLACRDRITRPQFIETIRISAYLERGADVDVVLDLMSHDLDLVLAIAPSPLKDLHAVGKALMTEKTDLANVRLIFEDGCVANMTASRISHKVERKLRIFQQDSYVSIDFAEPRARVYQKNPSHTSMDDMFSGDYLKFEKGDPLLAEIADFVRAIRTGGEPVVSGETGLRAMRMAEDVMRDIARNQLP